MLGVGRRFAADLDGVVKRLLALFSGCWSLCADRGATCHMNIHAPKAHSQQEQRQCCGQTRGSLLKNFTGCQPLNPAKQRAARAA
jgi:hypothetical protein